jgi:hypothetical protein
MGRPGTSASRRASALRTARAFHWWTLGSLYFLAGRYAQAASALQRAARWGTTDKPLYQGHLAVVRCASGQRVDDLRELSQRLAEVPAGQGYGRFILGHLAYYDGRLTEARRVPGGVCATQLERARGPGDRPGRRDRGGAAAPRDPGPKLKGSEAPLMSGGSGGSAGSAGEPTGSFRDGQAALGSRFGIIAV